MAVNLSEPTDLLDINGASLGVAEAGIRYKNRDDLLVICFAKGSISSAVFTQNKFCAAPVYIAKENLSKASPRALLINSGNANAVTGEKGLQDAKQSCALLAEALDIQPSEVLPFSTGVIGELLPMDAIKRGITIAGNSLGDSSWLDASKAIMTTDTVAKAISHQFQINGEQITVTGIAKGSGMICPNMATMLGYVVTDAKVSQAVLDEITARVADLSFNAISVDGDTSTNDAYVVTATQQANNQCIENVVSNEAKQLEEAILMVSQQLAQAIVRDGEGATKFVQIHVSGGHSFEDCESVAYTLAHSPLVKTALFASDPNWGRLLMAVGRAPVNELDPNQVSVSVNGLPIVKLGQPDSSYTEEKGQTVFNQTELNIHISLGESTFEKIVWTTDLSHEYVSINADYRS